jgi:hypothetical protein
MYKLVTETGYDGQGFFKEYDRRMAWQIPSGSESAREEVGTSNINAG